MGVMTEFDIVYREDGGYGPDFINSLTFSHGIIGDLAGYVEFFSQLTEGDLIITLDAGLTYAHLRVDRRHSTGLRVQLRSCRSRRGLQPVCRHLNEILMLAAARVARVDDNLFNFQVLTPSPMRSDIRVA